MRAIVLHPYAQLPLEFGTGARVKKSRMTGLQEDKKIKIGLAVLIQYRRVTSSHPAIFRQ